MYRVWHAERRGSQSGPRIRVGTRGVCVVRRTSSSGATDSTDGCQGGRVSRVSATPRSCPVVRSPVQRVRKRSSQVSRDALRDVDPNHRCGFRVNRITSRTGALVRIRLIEINIRLPDTERFDRSVHPLGYRCVKRPIASRGFHQN